jgi:biotin carboxyl carrier protein
VAAGSGDVTSPLAGKVDSIDVKIGQVVKEGENVVTLEAMKMKTYVTASCSGTVTSINVNVGDSVEEDQSLVTIG